MMRLTFWCLSIFPGLLCAAPLHLDVNAKNAILMNAETGAILYEKHARIPAFPASTTKIATALYVLEEKDVRMEEMVTVSPEAVRSKTAKNRASAPDYWLESDGSIMGIVRGEMVSYESLLHGLLLVSGNDAANVLAESVSGSVPGFMDELNSYLKRIGCTQTEYKNPHGYHNPDHKTTAYDLCLMTQRALKIPEFREIVSKESYLRPRTNKRDAGELRQSNQLMIKSNKNYYPKAIGVKTGYHGSAGNVLVAAATHDERTLIAVVMGAEKRNLACADAKNLFEAAFAEEPVQRLLVPYNQTYTKQLPGAKKPVTAILTQDFFLTCYPAEETEIRAFVHWDALTLPIQKGQKIGEIRVVDPSHRELAACPLYSKEQVDPTFFFVLKEKWNQFVR